MNIEQHPVEQKTGLMPKLRFEPFKQDPAWTAMRGDAFFEQVNNKRASPGLPVLAITQEHGAIPRDLIDYHVSVTEQSLAGYKVVEVGDFIISLRSFQGGIEYSQYSGICSPAYIVLRPREKLSAPYFRHYFKTEAFIRALNKNLEGIRDGKMVSWKQFSELTLAIPSIPEGNRIAQCLSSLDDLIAAEDLKHKTLKASKDLLVRQLFPSEGETPPRLRFQGFESDSWQVKALYEIADVKGGKRIPKGYSLSKQKTTFPYIRVSDMRMGGIDVGSVQYITSEVEQQIKRYKISKNDLFITVAGTIGIVGMVPPELDNANLTENANKIVVKGIDHRFLLQYMLSGRFQASIKAAITNNAQPKLALERIRAQQIPFPGISEQQKVSECLYSLDEYVSQTEAKVSRLKAHKSSLLQQLLPSDEVNQ